VVSVMMLNGAANEFTSAVCAQGMLHGSLSLSPNVTSFCAAFGRLRIYDISDFLRFSSCAFHGVSPRFGWPCGWYRQVLSGWRADDRTIWQTYRLRLAPGSWKTTMARASSVVFTGFWLAGSM
jgi:hypothetical protein